MSVIVDTSVWSLALRRRKSKLSVEEQGIVIELSNLIEDSAAILINPVRQELLTGLKFKEQFNNLKDILRAFPDVAIAREDYELAAELSNLARSKGVQSTQIDSLIWAVCRRNKLALFSVDLDFVRLSKIEPIKLWKR